MRFTNFVAALRSHIAATPAKPCFVVDGTPTTWDELGRCARSLAPILPAPGSPSATRVALRIDEPQPFVRALLALVTLGYSVVPIPARLRPASIAAILRGCRPAAVIASDEEFVQLAEMAASARVIAVSALDAPDGGARVPTSSLADRPIDPDREMVIMYSSGTTSEPKGIVHTHRTRCHAAARAIRHYRIDENERTLINAPIYTARGIAPLLATAYAGGCTIVQSRFEAGAMHDIVTAYSPTTVDMVPTQYALLLDDRSFDPEAYAGCRFILCGGASLDPELRERLFAAFPANFVQGYGSTETDFVFLTPRGVAPDKHGSVGTARDVEIRVLDDGDEPLPAGKHGEIALCSPSNFVGYAAHADGAQNVFWIEPETGARYYRTGDVGSLDSDGYLWLSGRKKDMIITAGFNIFPSDLEQVVVQHPSVREVAVVAAPHSVLGETPLAFVVLEPPSRGASSPESSGLESDICRWANARLNANQRLYDVRVVASLPRNANGKVLKTQLAELARA